RQGDPRVARPLPHRNGRCRKIWVGEAADSNGDVSREAFALPIDGGTARRTEMKGDRVAAFGRPHPRRCLASEGDLLPAVARLVADHAPGAALALQAVAHRNTRRLTLNRKVELPAAAGGMSGGHRSAPGCCNGRSVDGTSKRRIMRVNSRRILVRERAGRIRQASRAWPVRDALRSPRPMSAMPRKRPFAVLPRNDAMGQKRTHAMQPPLTMLNLIALKS